MRIKVSRGTIAIGPMMMASGSGGGDPGGPPKPHAPTAPKPPKEPWWKRLLAWLTNKISL